MGFPGSSAGKESACSVDDLGSTPGSGNSPGEGLGYPLHHSRILGLPRWLRVKNPPAMQESWVRSLGWEDPLEEGMAIHSSILAWRIPIDRETWRATVHGVSKSRAWLND